jgi:tagatose-1,6-bisphosphate aldolase
MAVWAKYSDGVEVSEEVFRTLASFAPAGTLDVFASDQHGSYLKLLNSFFEQAGENRKAVDEDVTEVCRRFAAALEGRSTACLFNHLAYKSPGFRELLGRDVLLIGRLEDTKTEAIDGGRGQLARLAVQPEEAAPYVDGFKTLVKLDLDHTESWKRNLEWLKDVYRRARDLGKPLFNETLIFQRPGESKADSARRLPEALVKMARTFSPHGDFYKTQVPVLWAQEGDSVSVISDPEEVRRTALAMAEVCPRPMLLLSAAVDFSQYAAQYALVSDIFAGPMCGRAYFKEAFSEPSSRDWDSLTANFKRLARPRIRQIQDLASVISPAWWDKYQWMDDRAQKLIDTRVVGLQESVGADFGY